MEYELAPQVTQPRELLHALAQPGASAALKVCKRIVSRTDAHRERAAYPSGYGNLERKYGKLYFYEP